MISVMAAATERPCSVERRREIAAKADAYRRQLIVDGEHPETARQRAVRRGVHNLELPA